MKTLLSKYTKNRDNNFNLIRFIAASLVLYTHSFALATGDRNNEPLQDSLGMTFGNISVDIFFITSGFLIASSFFARNNIIAFIWARVLRIYPALIVAVTFCTFIVGLFFTTHTAPDYLSNPVTYKYFIKNITLFFGVEYNLPGVFANTPAKFAVNGSIWTLPYEVKMYAYLAIIGSVLIYFQQLISTNYLKIIFLMIAIIAIVSNVFNHFLLFFPMQPLHLFSMFFAGVAFYLYRDNIYLSARIFNFFLLALSLSMFNKEIFFIIFCLVIPYLVFYIAYVPAGIIRKFNTIGDYSYGIYIYAFPVQQSIAALIPNISITNMIVLSFTITFILSLFSWHFVEKKILKMKNNTIFFEKILKHIPLYTTKNLTHS